MGHELEVVDEVGLVFGWIQLKHFQLLRKDVEVSFEVFQVLIWLSFDLVLQISQCHRFFISIQR